jgi:hypothetical protein
MNLCPEHVDVRAAMRLIVSRAPVARTSTWMHGADQAAAEAASGIQESFEAHD